MLHHPTPFAKEIPYHCPLEIAAMLLPYQMVWLDSALQSEQGKYSFIAFAPFETITCKNGVVCVNEKCFEINPFEILSQKYLEFPLTPVEGLPPFQGGIAGMFGYELAMYLEKLPQAIEDLQQFPELCVGLYDLVVAYDHRLKKSWLFSSGYPEKQPTLRKARAEVRLAWALELFTKVMPLSPPAQGKVNANEIKANFNQVTYELAVKKVIEYIRAGDIFEANISQCFSALLPASLTPFELYRRLRLNNPAPFAAFMQFADCSIASASPERFLLLQAGEVETRPIKGTRPRHLDPIIDEKFQEELKSSDKDRAENIMIVDLMRNDLSRVCEPHTVKVPQLCGLETYATVHHLVSIVKARLQRDKTPLDLLKATFPGGSITGAPKIRTMEIIAEIEPNKRGPYCGSMGYIGFNGNMDLSITIRTYVIQGHMVTFQAGGAVTVDSDPAEEYLETLTKAKALCRTLELESTL